ncbi:capsid completion protein [Escherichia coli]|nr:capsid completion protein [Escherichia coli]
MKFVAPEQAPEQAEIIRNTPFWPDVDLSEFRSVMRTDGTVTQPRFKAGCAVGYFGGQRRAV